MQGFGSVDRTAVERRMREDWNARAREDAHYYVAFGRREQDAEEFFSTAQDVVRKLRWAMARLDPRLPARARRALEIGCGPGRLMRPLAAWFGELHGVDVADEMITRARQNLKDIPHAHAHTGSGADLAQFADASFDFIYSYAVFQHIPSAAVVWSYLREARRVLRPSGVLAFQVSGLPAAERAPDTWSGARIPGEELASFARDTGLQLLSLEGLGTQYLWCTMKLPAAAAVQPEVGACRIRRVTNAHSTEPCAPQSGCFAAASLWVEALPAACDLNGLEVRFRGAAGTPTYIGPPEHDGLVQVNALLPPSLPTGMAPVELVWQGKPLAPAAYLRILPAPPLAPHVVSVRDGVDLLGGTTITSGMVKVTVEEVVDIAQFNVAFDGAPVGRWEHFQIDPRLPAWEVNFAVSAGAAEGAHTIECHYRGRPLAPLTVDVHKCGQPES